MAAKPENRLITFAQPQLQLALGACALVIAVMGIWFFTSGTTVGGAALILVSVVDVVLLVTARALKKRADNIDPNAPPSSLD